MNYESNVFRPWTYHIIKSSLPPNAKHVLLNVATYIPESGYGINPGIDQLALDTGLTKFEVSESIDHAYAAGFLFYENDMVYVRIP